MSSAVATGVGAVAEQIQVLQQIINDAAKLRAELQKQIALQRRLPIMGNRVRTRINGKKEVEVVRPTGDYPATFNSRWSDLLEVSTGLGYFGERHPISLGDLQNLRKLEDFMAVFLNYVPPQHGGYLVARYQNIMSMMEAMSWKPESQAPEMMRELSRVPLTPIGSPETSSEEGITQKIGNVYQRMRGSR